MFDFNNSTVLIPFMADNPDRIFNINVILKFLNNNLKTNVVIYEQGNNKTNIDYSIFANLNIVHELYENTSYFHKTKLYNLGLIKIKTENTICLDSDVLIPISQMVEAKNNLDSKIHYCFPFNNNYIEISKLLSKERNLFLDTFDFETYTKSVVTYDTTSYRKIPKIIKHPGLVRDCPPGGCLFIKTKVYIDMGLENEDFYGYSPEDAERKHRLKTFEYTTKEVNGNLYHLDHQVSHKRVSNPEGRKLYNILINMKKEELRNFYINKQYAKKYGI